MQFFMENTTVCGLHKIEKIELCISMNVGPRSIFTGGPNTPLNKAIGASAQFWVHSGDPYKRSTHFGASIN
jgi:hypothetical protein